MNLAAVVAGHDPGAPALHDDAGWHRWGEVRARAQAVADGLRRLGTGPGDRVALVWPTSADFVVGYLGILGAGAVAVPLNPNSPAAELGGELAAVEPRVVLAGGPALDALAAVGTGARLVAGDDWAGLSAPAAGGYDPVARADDDLAVLLFTSGTAGAPRAAMLRHGNLAANLRQMLAVPGEMVRAGDVGLAAVPLFHIFGLNVALGLTLATGAALVLETRFDPVDALRLVDELGVTLLVGVPTMFAAWADPAVAGAEVLGRVRRAVSGAAALEPAVAAAFEDRFGVPLWQGYGLTEASPAVTTSVGTGRHRPGSVGRPLPGVEVRLVDEGGDDVLEGDPGEIWVRGPNVFAGYWRDDAATAEVLTADGWLRTGDVGVLGADQDLFVVDRRKDLIIVSGFNVFPGEVEEAARAVPGVADAVAVGRADPDSGEAVELFVVRSPDAAVAEAEVTAGCAAALARYKCPARVRFVDELPRGLHGKALRRALRESVS